MIIIILRDVSTKGNKENNHTHPPGYETAGGENCYADCL